MKLPEEPTKKVREILSTVLQCPGYCKINEKDLYEIKKLCDVLDTTISTERCRELAERLAKQERENKSLQIRLEMYDTDASALIEEYGCDPEDKIDREVLKRMLNYLIGENRRLKNEKETRDS